MYYIIYLGTYSKRVGRWCKNSQNWFQSEIAWKVITVCLTTGVSWKSIQLIHDKHFTWLWSHAGEIWGKLSGKISYHRSFICLVQSNLKITAEQIVENFPLVVCRSNLLWLSRNLVLDLLFSKENHRGRILESNSDCYGKDRMF